MVVTQIQTVDEALKTNNSILGLIANIVKNFDASETVNINIYDGETDHNTPGQTKGAGFVVKQFIANITLQTSYFQNSSKESVAATLIHEFIHTYLVYTNNNALNNHDQLASNYIIPMAEYPHNTYGISEKDVTW